MAPSLRIYSKEVHDIKEKSVGRENRVSTKSEEDSPLKDNNRKYRT